ncbi:MAG: hypothetical protein EPO16_12345 [Dehalococcoidia bacterium]|nr:MAG: hypothetical protein EPO16_12345 [Dehalococcoidia bacterium]
MPAPTVETVAVQLLAGWMGERFFRTFRVDDGDATPYDAVLLQRERRIGVTAGLLWPDGPVAGAAELADLLSSDIEGDPAVPAGGYAVWVPPRVALPEQEPQRSRLRVILARALGGLAPGERREVRLPATVKLAKIEAEGAYMSVTGGLAGEWLALSEGVKGAFHLDARAIHRTPSERAELDLILTRIRDRAVMLEPLEVTDVEVDDTWTVSRLPDGAPRGVTVVAAPESSDPIDGVGVRRGLRAHVARAVAQREAGRAELSVLVVVAALGHMSDEIVTASLRGMNPTAYGLLDLIALVADGEVRQVLQPRALPWAQS